MSEERETERGGERGGREKGREKVGRERERRGGRGQKSQVFFLKDLEEAKKMLK